MDQALLEMRNISKSFPGVKALDNVSLTVRPGTVHALMGENGAGKSTLMKCLFGIYHKDSGSIILDACFNIDASALITALGVGGIAVSLGFQDTLSNLIGGLQMTFMGIIKPGDNIEVGSEKGVVQDITWRHTTIKDNLVKENEIFFFTQPEFFIKFFFLQDATLFMKTEADLIHFHTYESPGLGIGNTKGVVKVTLE